MMSSESDRNQSRSRSIGGGFTLVELIAVLVITGVLAGITIPSLQSLGSSRAGAAQRQIQRDLTYARERAVTTGSRVWVVFAPASNSYSMLAEPAATPGRENALTLSDPATGRLHVTNLTQDYTSVQLVSAAFGAGTEVGFDWRGQPLDVTAMALSVPGIVTITGSRTITIQPGSGLASIP